MTTERTQELRQEAERRAEEGEPLDPRWNLPNSMPNMFEVSIESSDRGWLVWAGHVECEFFVSDEAARHFAELYWREISAPLFAAELAALRQQKEDAELVAWGMMNGHFAHEYISVSRRYWVLVSKQSIRVELDPNGLPIITPETRAILRAARDAQGGA
jgi:hypothetical protein